jgi:hypothetical protein
MPHGHEFSLFCITLIYSQAFLLGKVFAFFHRILLHIFYRAEQKNASYERLLFLSQAFLFYSFLGCSIYSIGVQDLFILLIPALHFDWEYIKGVSFALYRTLYNFGFF